MRSALASPPGGAWRAGLPLVCLCVAGVGVLPVSLARWVILYCSPYTWGAVVICSLFAVYCRVQTSRRVSLCIVFVVCDCVRVPSPSVFDPLCFSLPCAYIRGLYCSIYETAVGSLMSGSRVYLCLGAFCVSCAPVENHPTAHFRLPVYRG
jgi:hypothetical protein